jgi:hypothetical protein
MTPQVDMNIFNKLYLPFLRKKIRQDFSRLPRRTYLTPLEWIESGKNYTQAQKREFVELFNKYYPDEYNLANPAQIERRRKILKIMSFIKSEFYPTFKMYRAILGRDDLSKLMLGCLVKSIESEVYKSKHLVKHIKWHDRPAFLEKLFNKFDHFVAGDFSSLEASIKSTLAQTEFEVYSWVADEEVSKYICSALYETNSMSFKYWSIDMQHATRASGDVTTALGNALITLYTWKFIIEVVHSIRPDEYAIIVEGDDNLVGFLRYVDIKTSDFTIFGLIAKIEMPRHYSVASFCGMLFSPGSPLIVTDPIKILSRVGWTDPKYFRSSLKKRYELLRGKAFSNIYQYVNCPVVDAMSRYILRATRSVTHRAKITNKHHLLDEKIPTDERRLPPRGEIPMGSRLLVEEVFGLTVAEQLLIEKYFDETDVIQPIPNFGCFPSEWEDVWQRYVVPAWGYIPPIDSPLFTIKDVTKFVNNCSKLFKREMRIVDWYKLEAEDRDGVRFDRDEIADLASAEEVAAASSVS